MSHMNFFESFGSRNSSRKNRKRGARGLWAGGRSRHTARAGDQAGSVRLLLEQLEDRTLLSNVNITLDTYSHVLPGLQDAAAELLDQYLPHGR